MARLSLLNHRELEFKYLNSQVEKDTNISYLDLSINFYINDKSAFNPEIFKTVPDNSYWNARNFFKVYDEKSTTTSLPEKILDFINSMDTEFRYSTIEPDFNIVIKKDVYEEFIFILNLDFYNLGLAIAYGEGEISIKSFVTQDKLETFCVELKKEINEIN